MSFADQEGFVVTVEVVPPRGPSADRLLGKLTALRDLPVDAFSVATNPVARAKMSAMVVCGLIRRATGRPANLHCTTRDHNRLSLQGLLWGARALGIETVVAMTGDFVALEDRGLVSSVRDLDVFELIGMAREAGLCTGVVLDPGAAADGWSRAARRLERKVAAGAEFVLTQPVYDADEAATLHAAVRDLGVPVHLGILPLRTPRHADFLHQQVAGIRVPDAVRARMHAAADPVAEGAAQARDLVAMARERFAGALVMPPFGHFEVLEAILGGVAG